jgi:hypothetical protein
MTKQHPITPPLELVEQWMTEAHDQPPGPDARVIATQAAQWGADQELEAMMSRIEELPFPSGYADALRAACRPKPPSLKEQALAALQEAAYMADDSLHKGSAVTRLTPSAAHWRPSMTDFRALCADLHQALEKRCETLEEDRLLDRSAAALRAALAQPVPEGPTDEELDELAWTWYSKTGSTWYQIEAFRAYARAALAKWGHQ